MHCTNQFQLALSSALNVADTALDVIEWSAWDFGIFATAAVSSLESAALFSFSKRSFKRFHWYTLSSCSMLNYIFSLLTKRNLLNFSNMSSSFAFCGYNYLCFKNTFSLAAGYWRSTLWRVKQVYNKISRTNKIPLQHWVRISALALVKCLSL